MILNKYEDIKDIKSEDYKEVIRELTSILQDTFPTDEEIESHIKNGLSEDEATEKVSKRYIKDLRDIGKELGVKSVSGFLYTLIKENQRIENNKNSNIEKLEIGTLPTNTTTLLDKITYKLSAGAIPYKEIQPLKMEKRGSKKEITTYVSLDIDDIENILPDNINGEDISTLEAIISLLISNIDTGINTFTLNEVYRVERKNLELNPNKRTQEKLKNRILKLMKTLITIDSSEEKQAYYPDLFYKETSNLLNAHFLDVEVKGNKTMAIKILDMPLIYRYSKAKKQLTNIPFELTDNHLIKTDSVLVLEKYLCRRISQMRNSNKINKNILFSTIYKNMNLKQKSKSAIRNAEAKIRINTEEILKGLVLKKFIKDYDIKSEGRNKYHGLIIKL